MTIIISGLITLHVACQKILGLWPIMNSMSLLNLLESKVMRGKHKVTRYKHVYIYGPSNLICLLEHYIAIT